MGGIPFAVIAERGFPSTVRVGAVPHPRVLRSEEPGTVQPKNRIGGGQCGHTWAVAKESNC